MDYLESSSKSILSPEFQCVHDLLAQQIELGLHPGAQLCVAIKGKIVADFAVGETMVGSGVLLTNRSVMPLFSSAKPITAVALGILVENGELSLDEPVATYIPEFGAKGKSLILVRHLMNHTSGVYEDSIADRDADRDELIRRLSNAGVIEGWVPGERSAYIPTTGWYIMGELIQRVSGMSFELFLQQFIFDRVGMHNSYTYVDLKLASTLGSSIATMYDSSCSPMVPDPAYSTMRSASFARPGSSFHAPAHDLVLFYSMLLRDGVSCNGDRIISKQMVEQLTARQNDGILDETFGVVMDRGLGFFIDSQRHGPAVPYGYGLAASPYTFGHGGKESSTGFADPEKELAVSLIFNGMPGGGQHDRRLKQVLAAVYEATGF